MSRPFKVEIARERRGIETKATDSQIGKPKRKTPNAVVAQKWSGKRAAGNCVPLGQRYFNSYEVVTEIAQRWTFKPIGN